MNLDLLKGQLVQFQILNFPLEEKQHVTHES